MMTLFGMPIETYMYACYLYDRERTLANPSKYVVPNPTFMDVKRYYESVAPSMYAPPEEHLHFYGRIASSDYNIPTWAVDSYAEFSSKVLGDPSK